MVGLAIAVLAALVWAFADELAGAFVSLLTMEPERRTAIRESMQIVAAGVGAVSGILGVFAAIKTLLKRDVPDSQRLLSAYYQALRDSCERIDLHLLKLAERARHLSLHSIYQEMDAAPYISKHVAGQKTKGEDEIRLLQSQRKALMAWCADDEYQKVVVLGDAGSGKSMFVDTLAWRMADSLAGDSKAEHALPEKFKRRPVIRLRLRAIAVLCANKGIGSDFLLEAMRQAVIDLVGEKDAEATWEALWPTLRQAGVILLDGLDEIPETDGKRHAVLDAIDELVRQLGKDARLIVSSRPYVFESDHAQWLDAFASLQLKGFDDGQMSRFIEHWYDLTASHDHRTEAASRQEANELYKEISGREYLEEPARSPMILTLLIALHLANIKLPESRAKLYEASIELMLDHWTQRARREDDEYPLEDFEKKALLEIDGATRMTALAALALAAHRKKSLQIEETQILGMFATQLPDDCNATNLLDFVRYRSGLLKPGAERELEFYHRSFQAYLAARAITDLPEWQDEIDGLLREDFDWWQEVYLLLVGSQIHGGSRATAIDLLKRYVPEHIADYSQYPQKDWPWLFLAAKGVIEQQSALKSYSQAPYWTLRASLEKHLCHLVEGEYALPISIRAEAGRLLGELGDPRPGVGVKDGRPDIDWVEIPAGSFLMGTSTDEGYGNEKPAHSVSFEQPFKMSRYPVTNAQFACFVEAGGYREERYWRTCDAALAWWQGQPADLSVLNDSPELKESYRQWFAQEKTRLQPWFWQDRKWNNPNHPVVGICWYEALAYCVWMNENRAKAGDTGGRVRLPTEDEWEYAARGEAGLRYAWGQEADASLGNYRETELARTSTVGLFPPGKAFDLDDMSGNVWEWASSQWGKQLGSTEFSYDRWQERKGNERSGQRDYLNEYALRVVRGGAWNSDADNLRCAIRDGSLPDSRFNDLGFRLVFGL